MNKISLSKKHLEFIGESERKKRKILYYQLATFLILLLSWEICARAKIIDPFLISKPTDIVLLFLKYTKNGEIFKHVGISVFETVLGFAIGTSLGIFIAIILWWSEVLAKVLDPFLVVLNALPKTALAPILIIWAGAGMSGIVVIAVTISIVVTILSAYNYFVNVDEDKVKMLKTFGANKYQILTKLILPSNIGNLISIVKINIGMSWVGVIVGEFLVSRYGIGYLIVYGGQVFRLDLVMMGVFVLSICALFMYQCVSYVEKKYLTKKTSSNN